MWCLCSVVKDERLGIVRSRVRLPNRGTDIKSLAEILFTHHFMSSYVFLQVSWLTENCVELADNRFLPKDIYNRYKAFCLETGLHPMEECSFEELMRSMYPHIGDQNLAVRYVLVSFQYL